VPAAALCGNVRTTATEFARRVTEGGRDPGEVSEVLRAVVWRAVSASGCTVDALRPVVDTLADLLDPNGELS
jgi:hypothetical protein